VNCTVWGLYAGTPGVVGRLGLGRVRCFCDVSEWRTGTIGRARNLTVLPKPPKAEPRFEEDFGSEEAWLYGCVLCLRRPSTVPNRFRGFELCLVSFTAMVSWS
jgi:hypothetical protein